MVHLNKVKYANKIRCTMLMFGIVASSMFLTQNIRLNNKYNAVSTDKRYSSHGLKYILNLQK